MIWVTQFSTMGGQVCDPWIWAYPQHWVNTLILANLSVSEVLFVFNIKKILLFSWVTLVGGSTWLASVNPLPFMNFIIGIIIIHKVHSDFIDYINY